MMKMRSFLARSFSVFFILINFFGQSNVQANGPNGQDQIILLNDSASALEDSDPKLSKSLSQFADEKEKEWEDKGANNNAGPLQVTDKNKRQLQNQVKLLNAAAKEIQPTYPLIAKALVQMANDINRSIEMANEK